MLSLMVLLDEGLATGADCLEEDLSGAAFCSDLWAEPDLLASVVVGLLEVVVACSGRWVVVALLASVVVVLRVVPVLCSGRGFVTLFSD